MGGARNGCAGAASLRLSTRCSEAEPTLRVLTRQATTNAYIYAPRAHAEMCAKHLRMHTHTHSHFERVPQMRHDETPSHAASLGRICDRANALSPSPCEHWRKLPYAFSQSTPCQSTVVRRCAANEFKQGTRYFAIYFMQRPEEVAGITITNMAQIP